MDGDGKQAVCKQQHCFFSFLKKGGRKRRKRERLLKDETEMVVSDADEEGSGSEGEGGREGDARGKEG